MRRLALYLILLLPGSLFTQADYYIYGDIFPEQGQSLLYEEGYLYLLGATQAPLGKGNILLLRVDETGQPQWVRGIGGYERDLPTQLAWQGGQLQVLGRDVEPGNTAFIDDTFLHRIDPQSGLTINSIHLGNTGQLKDEEPRALLALPSPSSNGISVCIAMHDAVGSAQRAYFAGLNEQGALSAIEEVQLPGYSRIYPWALAASPSSRDTIYAAGMAQAEDDEQHGLLWVPFGSGISTASVYRVPGEQVFLTAVNTTPDGRVVIVGNIGPQREDLLILVTGSSGGVQHALRLQLPNGGELAAGNSMIVAADSTVYFTAQANRSNGARQGVIIALSPSGDELRAVSFGKSGTTTRLQDLLQLPDGRLAVIGTTQRFPNSDEDLLLLLMAEKDFNYLDCRQRPLELMASSLSVERRLVAQSFSPPQLSIPTRNHFNLAAPLRRKPDLCCPERDTLSLKLCPGERYDGQLPPLQFEELIDTAENCGILRLVRVDTTERPRVSLERSTNPGCGESDGGLHFASSDPHLQYSLDRISFQQNGQFNALSAGTFTLYARDSLGCTYRVQSAGLTEFCPVYLPNAFSPNGDGRNDLLQAFEYSGAGTQMTSARIFDRYGGLIYEYSGPVSGFSWDGRMDGRPLNSGVYTCVVHLQYSNGTTGQLRQAVHLVR